MDTIEVLDLVTESDEEPATRVANSELNSPSSPSDSEVFRVLSAATREDHPDAKVILIRK